MKNTSMLFANSDHYRIESNLYALTRKYESNMLVYGKISAYNISKKVVKYV